MKEELAILSKAFKKSGIKDPLVGMDMEENFSTLQLFPTTTFTAKASISGKISYLKAKYPTAIAF